MPNEQNGTSPSKDQIYNLILPRQDKILPLINGNVKNFERLLRSFAFEMESNDKLKQCSPLSIFNAFRKVCQYDLDPSEASGNIWLINYNGQLQVQVSYKGWLALVWRMQSVKNVYSYLIHEGDYFKATLGDNIQVEHLIPEMTPDSALKGREVIGSYAVIKLKNGENQVKITWLNEILKSRDESRGASNPQSPWNKWFESMALIVPLRKLASNFGIVEHHSADVDEEDNALSITTSTSLPKIAKDDDTSPGLLEVASNILEDKGEEDLENLFLPKK